LLSSDPLRYRGFIESGVGFGRGDFEYNHTGNSTMITYLSTSHGYRFNPHLYLGVGVEYNYYSSSEGRFMLDYLPVFLNLRTNFSNGKISPFLDVKAGYAFVEPDKGIYVNPIFGVSFSLSTKTAVYVGLGGNLQTYFADSYQSGSVISGIFRFGVEF